MTRGSKGLPAPTACVRVFATDDGDTNRPDQPDALPQPTGNCDDRHGYPSSRAGMDVGGEVGEWKGNGFQQ